MFQPFRRPALAAALAVALVAPSAASAQAAPPNGPPVRAEALDPAYEDLIQSIEGGLDDEAAYDGILASAAREYARVPEFARMEAEKPGFIDAMVAAVRPTMITFSKRVKQEYRPRMLAVFARHVTPAEASDIAEVYRSPTGRKLMGLASRNVNADAVLAGMGDALAAGEDPTEKAVTRAQVAKDMRNTTASVLDGMSPQELADMGLLMRKKPALLKMQAIGADMISLRTAMENEAPNAEETAALEEAIIAVVKKHLDS